MALRNDRPLSVGSGRTKDKCTVTVIRNYVAKVVFCSPGHHFRSQYRTAVWRGRHSQIGDAQIRISVHGRKQGNGGTHEGWGIFYSI